jgi:hypothetical protein
VKFAGVDELHAAFLNESRTRGTLWDRVQEIRVSARFWQMWDSTVLDRPPFSPVMQAVKKFAAEGIASRAWLRNAGLSWGSSVHTILSL